jgi:quinolinate synthase
MIGQSYPIRLVLVVTLNINGVRIKQLDVLQKRLPDFRLVACVAGEKSASILGRFAIHKFETVEASLYLMAVVISIDMLSWQDSCLVHPELKGIELDLLRADHPDAKILVHPESPEAAGALADAVGSRSSMMDAAV